MNTIYRLTTLFALTLSALGADVKFSALPTATSPSTNSYLPIIDLNLLPAAQNQKYLLTNLAAATPAGITNALGISTTPTELQYVSGVTSAIQAQLNSKGTNSNWIASGTTNSTLAGIATIGSASQLNLTNGVLVANGTINVLHGGTNTVGAPLSLWALGWPPALVDSGVDTPGGLLKLAYSVQQNANQVYNQNGTGSAFYYSAFDTNQCIAASETGREGFSVSVTKKGVGKTSSNTNDHLMFMARPTEASSRITGSPSPATGRLQIFTGIYGEQIANSPLTWNSESSANEPMLYFRKNQTSPTATMIFEQSSATAGSMFWESRKSRGSLTTPTATSSGDSLWNMIGSAYTGSAWGFAAEIDFLADATASSGSSPGAIAFYTTPAGAVLVSERMRITSTGLVGIGTNAPTQKLDVIGTNRASAFMVSGTTNQVIFGATNSAPVSSAAPTKWISVQVSGESTVYRLPLYE